MIQELDSYIFVLEKNVAYHMERAAACKEAGDELNSYYHSARVDSINLVIKDLQDIFIKANAAK